MKDCRRRCCPRRLDQQFHAKQHEAHRGHDFIIGNCQNLVGIRAGNRECKCARRLHSQAVGDGWHLMVTTGTMGGLSTFSSFAYASSVLMTASMTGALVAAAYVLTSLVMGYVAVIVGMKIGAGPAPRNL